MSNNDIQNYLPHRYPFLLIDKIIDFKKHDYLIAQKNVSNNEPFFQGHFPGYPVFPGVLILEAMAQATALLDFKSNNEPFFQGHFPGYPVFPGVLILEAMAQATALLDFKSNERPKDNLLYYFVGIDKARFKKPVVPGDILIIDVKLNQSKRDVHKFTASSKVDEKIVCSAELIGAVREKE